MAVVGITTKSQIIDAIRDTIITAVGLGIGQSYDELTASIPDTPMIQVYLESYTQDPTGNNDRTTFGAAVRQTVFTVHCDLYARQRSQLGEDMRQLMTVSDEIDVILENQDTKPYFGIAGIKSFSWVANRVTFTYGDAQQPYIGMRYIFSIRTF